jgi:hypothetical protein
VGPPQYPFGSEPTQQGRSGYRQRRCLLKGCERWYQPSRPQSRYCSEACREAARRWRRWQASRRWRATPQGQERRREQSRRYRQRRRERVVSVAGSAAGAAVSAAGVVAACEGQRPAVAGEDFAWRPCQRPGCYELFVPSARSPGQHFCSCLCRRALRRVLDREAHWRRRCRRRQRERRRRSRPPPNSS